MRHRKNMMADQEKTMRVAQAASCQGVGVAQKVSLGLSALLVAGVMTGCSGLVTSSSPTGIAGGKLTGHVHGGQQPVANATIQLYTVGSGGYGSAATALLHSTTTTDSQGYFNILTPYTCPSGQYVYMTATGGNPGNAGGAVNPNLAVMAALGLCDNLNSSTFINVNEITTIASVWPLAPFMTGPQNVGTSPGNAVGLANAFGDVKSIADTTTGRTPGPGLPSGATISTAEVNTLADILANCINSPGGSAGDGSACGDLFAAANPSGTAPSDTVTAAVNIAKNPALNVSTLYPLAGAPQTGPFQPILETQPNDFTLAMTLTATISSPAALAADASGNIYVANASNVSVLTPSGTPGAPLAMNSVNGPSAIAIDQTGSIWVTNKGNNSVSKLTSTGADAANSPISGFLTPTSIAIDANGTAWVADNGDSTIKTISSDASTVTSYTPTGVTNPVAIAVNPH